MANFFQDIAEKFKLLPALAKQTWKTAEAKTTEQKVAAQLAEAQKPKQEPIKTLTADISPTNFFGDIAKKYGLAIPEPKLPEPKPITPIQKAVAEMTPEEKWSATGTFTKELAKIIPSAVAKVGVSLYQTPEILATAKSPEAVKVPKLLQPILGEEISSYGLDVERKIKAGENPVWAFLTTGAMATWDASIVGSLIKAGAQMALKGIKAPDTSHYAAWEALGKPATIEAAKKEYRGLAQILHPDKPTGSTQAMSALNNAYRIIEKQGIPKVPPQPLKIVRDIAQVLETPVSKIMEHPAAQPYLGTKGLLTEKAGAVPTQPFRPVRPAPAGLAIREVPEKPITPPAKPSAISKELEPLVQTDELVGAGFKRESKTFAEKSLFRTYLEYIEEGGIKSKAPGIRKGGPETALFTEFGRSAISQFSPVERGALFDKAKKLFPSELAKAKNLGFENIKDFNRANRLLDEIESINPTIKRESLLPKLGDIFSRQRRALKADDFVALKEINSEIDDFYNQATKGIKEVKPIVKTPGLPVKTEDILREEMKAKQITGELPPTVPPIKEPPTILPRAKEFPLRVEMETKGITQKELASDSLYQKTGITARAADEAETIAKEFPTNPTKWNRFVNLMRRFAVSFKEKIVNDWQRVKELKTEGMKLTGELTPYERRKLMAGRQTARLQKAEEVIRSIDKDILDTSKRLKIKDAELQDEVFDYLIARHAPERNAAIGEKAAGITTKEAGEIMARIEKSPHAEEIKRIADSLQKYHNETLDILYAEGNPWGVIDKELYDLLKTKYKNHIPLNRVMDSDDIAEVLSGKGLAVKGTGLRRAVGSEREVRDIMENIYSARIQAIQRVEKNIVDNETFQFVKDYIKSFPEQNLFEIIKPQAIGRTFEGKIILGRVNDPSVLQFQRYGKPAYIKINDTRLAVALRGVNREKLAGLIRYSAAVVRWMSSMVTRYSPEFALSNKIRDMQEAVVYMASQEDIGFKGAAKMIGRDPASVNDVKDFILGKETAGTKLYKQMIEDGGTTGGLALSTREQVEAILNDIRSTNRSISRKGFKAIAESVDKWNTVFEDSTRLSAYKQALEDGLSRDKAAIVAKNVSVDFDEFGTWGPVINSIYMFANASIQGSAKMIRAMRNPKVAAAVVAAVGVAVFSANEWNDFVDPDWRDKVSKWDKLNGLNIVIPGTKEFYYISIPVSWALKPIKVVMEYGSDIATGYKAEIGEITEGIFVALMEGYNPVGGTDFASALTPSTIEPFIDISRNRQWTGSKIRPDWNAYAPSSTQYFKDLEKSQTGKMLISITKSVSEKTGGRIEVSPADAEYILQQITGGPGKFTAKVFNSVSAIGKAEVPEPRDVPFVSRILRKTPEERFYTSKGEENIIKTLTEQERERFYNNQEAEKVFEEMKKLPVEQRKETYKELKQKNPQLIERVNKIADDEEKGLTRLDRQILQLGVENGERAKYLFKVFKSAEPQEKKELYSEYRKKGIISDNVKKQLDYLFSHQ